MRTFQIVLETLGRRSSFHLRMREVRGTLVRVVGRRLLLYAFVDEHGHGVVEVPDRATLGALTSGLHRAFAALGIALEPIRVTHVADARHLANLVAYVVRQPAKHAVSRDPAAWDGTCLPELVGARLRSLDPSGIERALPRIDVPATALRALGLPSPLVPATDAEILALGARPTWAAAHAAFSASPGRTAAAADARAAFATLGREAGLSEAELLAATGTSRWAWRRTVAVPSPVDHVMAVRRNVALQAAILGRSGAPVPEYAPAPVRRWIDG